MNKLYSNASIVTTDKMMDLFMAKINLHRWYEENVAWL